MSALLCMVWTGLLAVGNRICTGLFNQGKKESVITDSNKIPESPEGEHTVPSQDFSLITWLLRAYDFRDQLPGAEERNASPAAPARQVVLPGFLYWITRWEYSKIEEDVQRCWAVTMKKPPTLCKSFDC